MNWTEKVIPFHLHPLGFIDSFHYFGAELSDILAHAGINGAVLEIPDSKISYRQFVDILRIGIQLCNRPGLGLLVGQKFDWYYYGLPGIAMLSSTNFKEATTVLHRYTCLVQPYYGLFKSKPTYFVDNHQRVTIPIQYLLSDQIPDLKLHQFEVEYRVGLMMRIIDHFRGASEAHSIVDVQLAIPRPAHAHLYKEYSGYQFQFNCRSSRFVFPASMLSITTDRRRKGLFEDLVKYCRMELSQIEKSTSYSDRVRALFYEHVPDYLSQTEVAKMLGITSRTLARKLHQENTTFTDLLNDVRKEIATYFLDSTQLSVADIAESVGFSDTTNFRQAFKRWTGYSACQFREVLRSDPSTSKGAALETSVESSRL